MQFNADKCKTLSPEGQSKERVQLNRSRDVAGNEDGEGGDEGVDGQEGIYGSARKNPAIIDTLLISTEQELTLLLQHSSKKGQCDTGSRVIQDH